MTSTNQPLNTLQNASTLAKNSSQSLLQNPPPQTIEEKGIEDALDHALKESFPASDAPSIMVSQPSKK